MLGERGWGRDSEGKGEGEERVRKGRERERKERKWTGMEKGERGEEIDAIVCVTVSHRDDCGC